MRLCIGESAGSTFDTRAALHDSLLLAVIVVLSCLPYTGGLGLYSDDWGFLASLHGTDGTYADLLASVMGPLGARPVQGHVLAVLYWLFGMDLVGWHAANCAALTAAVLLFYHSLRLLGCARRITLVVPLIFGLLPHYSTDRVWIAVFQANAAILLYFGSLYADSRFVVRSGRSGGSGGSAGTGGSGGSGATGGRGWPWKAIGTAALVGSVLAYEVTAALFIVNVVVLLHVAGVRRHGAWVRQAMPAALALGTNILVLALTIGYKLTQTARADIVGGYRYRALRVLTEAVPVHFGEYGIVMPVKVVRAVRDYPDALITAVSVLVAIIVGAYLFSVLRSAAEADVRRVSWPTVIVVGGVLFGAGYGVALMTWEVGFHTTGPNNRTAIGAAIGVAWVFTGVIGWISGMLPTDRLRRAAFAGLVALLAAGSTLLTNTVAAFWVEAARRQDTLIAGMRERIPALPPNTTLLLDGICPFHGPAPVFATDWDMDGMLQLTWGDPSLRGDVIKPNTELTPAGVRTILFDDWINVYPYDERLIVYHAKTGETYPLASLAAAQEYFETVGVPERPDCPPYTDGDGARIY
jgi:hypothetical protein